MTLANKIIFLQKSMNLTDREFCAKFKIKGSSLRKLKSGKGNPLKKEVVFLCDEFNLDIDDFVSDSSTVSYIDLKEGEHPCKLKLSDKYKERAGLEDFTIEDNSRYEEKD